MILQKQNVIVIKKNKYNQNQIYSQVLKRPSHYSAHEIIENMGESLYVKRLHPATLYSETKL